MVAAIAGFCGSQHGNLVAHTYSNNTYILLTCSCGRVLVDKKGIQESEILKGKFGLQSPREGRKRVGATSDIHEAFSHPSGLVMGI
jgi:hypothetical protein